MFDSVNAILLSHNLIIYTNILIKILFFSKLSRISQSF